MKKIFWIVLLVIVVIAGLFIYLSRPISAPSQDITTVSSKLVAGSATSSVYRISQADSLVKFTMNEMLRGEPFLVVGTTTQIAGDIEVANGKLKMGELAINAKTLVTDSAQRNGAIARLILKSETPGNEFIVFKPSLIDMAGQVENGKTITFNVQGNLTISMVTKPVTFAVTATVTDGKITGSATTTIKRTDFGLKIPNLSFIANVDDEFPITVTIVANRIML